MALRKFAATTLAGALILGGGAAFAQTVEADPEPALEETTDTTTVVEDPVVEPVEETTDTDTVGEEPAEEEGSHPDNHGKIVSEAAHSETPEGFRNHGAYVSSVARGEKAEKAAKAPKVAKAAKGKGKSGK